MGEQKEWLVLFLGFLSSHPFKTYGWNFNLTEVTHSFSRRANVSARCDTFFIHYALDIRQESDAYLCERTLRNYRKKVLASGFDQVLFRTLTDKLIEEIGVDTTKQRLDSTSAFGEQDCK